MTEHRIIPVLNGAHAFLQYTGMETDLIFNRGMELPGFASYPLLETEAGRQTLREYSLALVEVAKQFNMGVMLDSVTWVANRDRGEQLGYTPRQLAELNRAAIDLVDGIRKQAKNTPVVLSAQMGPRGDGYAPSEQMSAEEAERYHLEQMEVLCKTPAEMVNAFTLCYPEEAIGIVRAGNNFDMPVAVAFTVETDGRLPTGLSLKDAIERVDEATDRGAVYFMVNCAHPDHFSAVLQDEPWIRRVLGMVVNASRCSHAELDNAQELDDGDPVELGDLVGEMYQRFPHFRIFGGCCGTDMRHMKNIAKNIN